MAIDIQVRQNNNNEPFVLDDSAEVVTGIILAASQGALGVGAVLGEVTATPGTYKLVDFQAIDGSQAPKLILATPDVINSVAVTENLAGYEKGLFDENQLEFASGTDIDSNPTVPIELMPNLVDRDFSGASAWTDVDWNAYDETGDLTLTATAADQYCTLAVASAPTVIGQKYKVNCDVANLVGTIIIQDFTGAQVLGTISAEGLQNVIEFTAETTGGFRVVAGTDTASVDLDNFSLNLLTANDMRDVLRAFNILLAPGISVSGYENT